MNQPAKADTSCPAPLRAVAAGPDRSVLDPRQLMMHQVMLGDRRRLDAYRRAIAASVRPGDVVIDVGAGTLALSLLALDAGAGHVHAIEADPAMAAVALEVAAENGLTDRVSVICGDARSVQLPSAADVIVSEMMGNLGPEEEMAQIVKGVAERCLKPGGRVVPGRLVTAIQAIGLDGEGWGVWAEPVPGYSMRSVLGHAPKGGQFHFFARPPALFSDALPVADSTLGQNAQMPAGRHRLATTRDGDLHAIAMHFTAHLAPDVTLSNFPSYPGSNWAVWLWPLRHTRVEAGDALHIDIQPPADVRQADDWTLDCQIERISGRA
ncbi:MAG: methyltransferase domain-containing protein [Phyllobacteriaceae bacterium]|jgi:SAM-dependent methyltransferase|nr:methyltransferase domain-containing protein [Phyllobacteriaceae bacterium]